MDLNGRVLAIDPGSSQSAWLVLEPNDGRVVEFGIEPNEALLGLLRSFGSAGPGGVGIVVIEKIESYGMAVGREVFDTVWWAGRFAEAVDRGGVATAQMPRRQVKLHICGSARATDSNIHVALLDRYGGSSAKGTKAAPGPLYGISKDVWSALAIAVTWADQHPAAAS